MQFFSLLFLHLLWDTLILFILLRVALRERAPRSQHLGMICLGMALCKAVLFYLLGVVAIIPVLLSIGLFLSWAYALTPRKILYVLAAFLVVGIVFGSILRMANGVLELFFI